MKIEAKTWIRDSHGLYDYESSQLNIQNLKFKGSCNIYLVLNIIVFCMRNDIKVTLEPPTSKMAN